MKTLPPALVLLATALLAASFGACNTESPELGDQSQSATSTASEATSDIDQKTPVLDTQSIEKPSATPQILSTIGSDKWQTDPAFVPKQSYATSITTVIDGDTITAMIDGKPMSIRLIGIDTPESSTSTRPEECGGEEASQFLQSILPQGTPILLTRDQELLDPYNRLLAYVHRQSDGLFINLALAKYGMANELSFPPNTLHAAHIRKAVTAARASDAGVWSLCGSTA